MSRFNIISTCCVCGAVYGYTIVADPDSPDKVSHGYCDDCAAMALVEAKAIRRES